MRIRTTTVAWTSLGTAIFVVSVALTRHRLNASVPPPVAHFSGSTVIAKMPSLLEPARLSEPLSVDILRDNESAAFYDAPAVLDSIIAAWKSTLAGIGASVRVVSSEHIPHPLARVLVIPSSPCLTIASRQAIETAANAGRGVVVTALTGNRDIGCRDIGFGFIVGSTGSARAQLLGARASLYATFPAGSPLSTGIPPGARLELSPGTDVVLRTTARDAFYSDYALRPAPENGEPLLDAAITHADLGRGRLVYWGFELRDVANSPWNREIAALLVRNSVAWAAALPSVAIEPWPHGKRAAASIAQDVEDQFSNARLALDSLRAAGMPTTYFLVSQLAMQNEQLTRDLAAAGEVGSHTENHWVLGGNSADVQRRRLHESLSDLKSIVPQDVEGLRPPEEQFDAATLAQWAAEGGTYVFAVNDERSAAPELLAVGRDTIVLVERIGDDDFAVAAENRGDPRGAAEMFLREFRDVRALGGAYVLSYHSQLLSRPEWISSLAIVARAIAADTSVWRATTGQLALWCRARASVLARVNVEDRAVRITVRNTGTHAVKDAVVHVGDLDLPDAIDETNMPLLPAADGELRLLVPTLAANETKTFTAPFIEPAARSVAKPGRAKPRHRVVRRLRRAPHWSWRRLFRWLH
jgi:hypothetical protein